MDSVGEHSVSEHSSSSSSVHGSEMWRTCVRKRSAVCKMHKTPAIGPAAAHATALDQCCACSRARNGNSSREATTPQRDTSCGRTTGRSSSRCSSSSSVVSSSSELNKQQISSKTQRPTQQPQPACSCRGTSRARTATLDACVAEASGRLPRAPPMIAYLVRSLVPHTPSSSSPSSALSRSFARSRDLLPRMPSHG